MYNSLGSGKKWLLLLLLLCLLNRADKTQRRLHS